MNKKNYEVIVKDKTAYLVSAETKEQAEDMALMEHNGGETIGVEVQTTGIICSECENIFQENEVSFAKYQEDTWLCDDCHDKRMEEDNE